MKLRFAGSQLIWLSLMVASCGGGSNSTSPGSNTAVLPAVVSVPIPPAQTPSAETTLEFIARTGVSAGFIDLVDPQPRINFTGCLRKNKTGEPRVLGGAHFLTNLTGREYRLVSFAYYLDTSGLLSGETVESDIGFTILPKAERVALNSGEETMITHRYDAQPLDRGVIRMALPAGGVAIQSDQRLSVGSVSAILPVAGGGAQIIPDARLEDGTFMRVCYEAEVVRADLADGPRIASYRSAFRDRAYVSDPARITAPHTDFINSSKRPVKVYGISSFLSNLSSSEISDHGVDVHVNGQRTLAIALPSHIPGTTTELYPIMHPVDVTLNPGDVLSVRGVIKPRKAIVFDFAAFIFADEGLTPTNEQLNLLDADLNGDGFKDILDIDATGSIWVSIRVSGGLQETQTEWARDIKRVERMTVLPRASSAAQVVVQATNSAGLCLNLRAVPTQARFVIDYCSTNGNLSLSTDLWGDFDGDGWPDRLRVSASPVAYMVALGGASGLSPDSPWVIGYGAVDKMFVSDSNGDGKSDVIAEWSDASGYRCALWISTGSAFRQTSCR